MRNFHKSDAQTNEHLPSLRNHHANWILQNFVCVTVRKSLVPLRQSLSAGQVSASPTTRTRAEPSRAEPGNYFHSVTHEIQEEKAKQSVDGEKEETCVYTPALRPEELVVSCSRCRVRVQTKFGGGPVPIQLDSSGSVVFLWSGESGGDPRLLLCSSSVYYRDWGARQILHLTASSCRKWRSSQQPMTDGTDTTATTLLKITHWCYR